MPWYSERTKIKKATIENGVAPKNINGWFRNCENLITAPKIPASVEKMENTFENCKSLTGKLQVYCVGKTEHSRDIKAADCLKHAAIKEGCKLKIDYVDKFVYYILLQTAIIENGADNTNVCEGEQLKAK